MLLKVKNEWFVDEYGRKVLLRGVNLGGNSKVPFKPNGATHIKTNFTDHRVVSFIGRPFPIKEAELHFKRIKHWGFNCLRFLITWEAIEHSGPGKYDKEFLDYIEEILKIAGEFKLYAFIDPHQDVWSRMTGGDGAPGWTFEKVGLDYSKFNLSEAALVMQYRFDPLDPNSYPPMHWVGNSLKFANGTMWTLFFGSKKFAPSSKIDGIPTQDYLQDHYLNAIKQVALRIKDNPYIIGFDTLNEPNQGWIELKVDGSNIEGFSEVLGYAFTPIDAMLTGSGYPRTVGYREIKRFGIRETRKDIINKNKVSCWLDGYEDIWKKEGVWDLNEENEPVILNNDHFTQINGKNVIFHQDFLSPFINNYTKIIRSVIPDTIMFFEGPAEKLMKGESFELDFPSNIVNAGHWYDVATLGTQKPMLKANFDTISNKPVIGKNNVQNLFIKQLSIIKEFSKTIQNGIPTLIGEFGLPYNLNNKEAYHKFKTEPEIAWKSHIKALSMYYNALDANLLHATQWNYTADNTNQWGDQWNLEDLSIFSADQRLNPEDINSGGRAIEGFCRPHLIACAGTPLKMEFKRKGGEFIFEFEADKSIGAPTILYLPKIQYPHGFEINLSEGNYDENHYEQIIFIRTDKSGKHQIKITRKD
ncbi:MAG: glycosyl hydrolase family 5 [Candidatus Lokiarchaeota archaeon]|nr:glycosyl hydrolase family 5 [Candidatus Lokiarchaeota archaeon]